MESYARVWFPTCYSGFGNIRIIGLEALSDIATMTSAIEREKAIMQWMRAWKLKTIETLNPGWRDLYPELI
ncbi:MAG: hypothetical protein ABW150_00700 [Candidatus Thiodiazotropha sp.]